MVASTSGLQPARRKSGKTKEKKKNASKLEFQICIRPAPMGVKPLASLINPFRSGCSIFCNHPTKNVGLKAVIQKTKRRKMDEEKEAELMGQILEDMICRYGAARGGGTGTGTTATSPDSSQQLPQPAPPRPQLVLNLRRSISQETGRTSVGLQSTFSPSPSSLCGQQVVNNDTLLSPPLPPEPLTDSKSEQEEEGTDVIKRRGKLRKKKKKGQQSPDKGEKEVTDLVEPNETLVSTCREGEYDSEDWEEEGGGGGEEGGGHRRTPKSAQPASPPPLFNSDIFDYWTLRHLRRSLSASQVESEFRRIWRRVLSEALGASEVLPKDEVKIGDDIAVPNSQPETWISYPRTFSRAAARFDLPINKTLLNEMTPLEYLREYVAHKKTNMLLFEYVFKKYTTENNCLTSEGLIEGLGEVMGRPFTSEEATDLNELIDIHDEPIDYRMWLGICAITERFYGEKFSTGKNMNMGRRQILEEVDFEYLQKRMENLKLNPKIAKLLNVISTS